MRIFLAFEIVSYFIIAGPLLFNSKHPTALPTLYPTEESEYSPTQTVTNHPTALPTLFPTRETEIPTSSRVFPTNRVTPSPTTPSYHPTHLPSFETTPSLSPDFLNQTFSPSLSEDVDNQITPITRNTAEFAPFMYFYDGLSNCAELGGTLLILCPWQSYFPGRTREIVWQPQERPLL